MKKIFGFLLFALSFSLCALASRQNPKQDFLKLNVESEAVMPNHEDLTFDEMVLSPLDVFAHENLADSLLVEDTCKGFAVEEEKPPVGLTGLASRN